MYHGHATERSTEETLESLLQVQLMVLDCLIVFRTGLSLRFVIGGKMRQRCQ